MVVPVAVMIAIAAMITVTIMIVFLAHPHSSHVVFDAPPWGGI